MPYVLDFCSKSSLNYCHIWKIFCCIILVLLEIGKTNFDMIISVSVAFYLDQKFSDWYFSHRSTCKVDVDPRLNSMVLNVLMIDQLQAKEIVRRAIVANYQQHLMKPEENSYRWSEQGMPHKFFWKRESNWTDYWWWWWSWDNIQLNNHNHNVCYVWTSESDINGGEEWKCIVCTCIDAVSARCRWWGMSMTM